MKSKAQGLGDEILEAYPKAKIFLEGGQPGQFDVICKETPQIFNLSPGSTILFSKEVTNRYPKEGEIIVLLR